MDGDEAASTSHAYQQKISRNNSHTNKNASTNRHTVGQKALLQQNQLKAN